MIMGNDALGQAIDRAVAFLKKQLLAGDYGLTCIGSDGTPRFSHNKGHVFTGFFIAEALANVMTELDRTMLLVRILSEENRGLWGFSPPAPFISPDHEVFVVDADDTAYVLRTLRQLGVNRSPECLMTFHRTPARLFTTFNAPGETRLAVEPRAAHNLLAHPEVNANVFTALRGTNFDGYINYELVRHAQANDGHWRSYFYPNPLFATYLFLDLIHGLPTLVEAERQGIVFLTESQNANGSWGQPGDVYDTALAANALAACDQFGQPLDRGITYLLDAVESDGSWRTGRCVWEFHADETDVWRAYDSHGTLVSALCTLALRRAAAAAASR